MASTIDEARRRLAGARLYVVSADARPDLQADVLCQAIDGGAEVVQLRNKAAAPGDLLDAARRVAEHAHAHDAVFIVNDVPELADTSGADGVHVGQDGGPTAAIRLRLPPGSLVGRSTHSLAQAQAAAAGGADYLGVGPVWETPTKPGRRAVGTDLLGAVAATVAIPWFAIGGINGTNLAEVLDAGARRVAVVRAVAVAPDAAAATRALLARLAAIEVLV